MTFFNFISFRISNSNIFKAVSENLDILLKISFELFEKLSIIVNSFPILFNSKSKRTWL